MRLNARKNKTANFRSKFIILGQSLTLLALLIKTLPLKAKEARNDLRITQKIESQKSYWNDHFSLKSQDRELPEQQSHVLIHRSDHSTRFKDMRPKVAKILEITKNSKKRRILPSTTPAFHKIRIYLDYTGTETS